MTLAPSAVMKLPCESSWKLPARVNAFVPSCCTTKKPLPLSARSVGTPVGLMLPWEKSVEVVWILVPAPTWSVSPEPLLPICW